ncbi:hypothetical protein V8G69_03055 [Gaetbulibacter sp. M235]|uniref:hypothetical protein n=1 Tax=Gaetbulibacter sp. M235 TaxID=3126510 RepID=UPI00374E9E4D
MKTTWYFGALLILFISLGIYQNRISEPNQEIVLKFSDIDITSDEAQNAVVIVKEQLQAIGVNTIQVQELKDGQLKITYYSSVNIESVKKALSDGNHIDIEYASNNQYENTPKFPSEKKTKNYKLDVFEIHKGNDLDSGLNGKFVLNLKQDFDRFYKQNVYVFNNEIDARHGNEIANEALKILKNIAIAIDNTSRNIPEVRAGPTTIGIA